MSYKIRQIDVIKSIILSDWTDKAIIIHNKITDIRQLIELIDEYKFYDLDEMAVEIETISGVCLGNEKETISMEQKIEMEKYVNQMKKFLENYKLQQ
jgi:hypothetical protein